MRLLSCVMAALTVLCVFQFLRELLPGSPLAWTVGALLAGLEPMFAFVSSGVNNDAGLYLVSAALMLALAQMLRRGLTAKRAAAAGALLGAGILVKTQVIAYAPAVGLALLVAWRRTPGPPWRAWAAAIGARRGAARALRRARRDRLGPAAARPRGRGTGSASTAAAPRPGRSRSRSSTCGRSTCRGCRS